MHLKTLTLKGFKSFASSTTLHLEPGVTCVVGPNGSGKSNVVDALAWKDVAVPPLGEGAPAPDAADGSSLSRCNLLVESGDNALDFVVTTPTPGTAIAPDEALCR